MIDLDDFLTYRIAGVGAACLYGVRVVASTSQIFRLTSVSDTPTTPISTIAGTVNNIWEAPTNPAILLARVGNLIYRSADSGVTWAQVLQIGMIGSTPFATSALQRGLAFIGSSVFIAEYNTVSGRVNGGTNDAVRLLRSNDLGATWSVAAVWNTDGTNYTRHMHGCIANSGYLYLMFGDDNYQSGIVRWDPTTVLASNQPLSGYANAWIGQQRYRTGDILFPPGDYMYWMADSAASAASAAEIGVWRGRKDMTGSPVRLDSTISAYPNQSGWYGAVLSDGSMVFTSFIEAGATGEPTLFFGSDDGGTTWRMVGRAYITAATKGGTDNCYAFGDRLLYYRAGLAGKATESVSLSIKRAPMTYGESSRVLHPVYWLSPAGTDSVANYQGQRPATPWRTLGYALTGNRITCGARLRLAGGNYAESPIVGEWSANASPSGSADALLLEGSSGGETLVTVPGAADARQFVVGAIALRNVRIVAGDEAERTRTRSQWTIIAGM